jgi:hypothetical protein
MIFRTSLSVLTLLCALCASNASAQMFAGYDQFCGVPVVVVPNPQTASAARDQFGRPVIYVDPGVMANWTMSRMFALAHECAHHKLGHTLPQGMWFRNTQHWATRQQELAADCWAAKALAEIEDRGDLQRTIMQFASQGAMAYGAYPTGAERARNVARCAGIDPAPKPMPIQGTAYCCDAFGNRRCVITMNPGAAGSMCGCIGQGYGVTCY